MIVWKVFKSSRFFMSPCSNAEVKDVKMSDLFLTFRRPCNVIFSYNKSQQDALFLDCILLNTSNCFGQVYCPSSGVLILYSQQLVFVVLVMLTVCQQTVNITSNMQRCLLNKVEKQCILLAFIIRMSGLFLFSRFVRFCGERLMRCNNLAAYFRTSFTRYVH